MLTIYKYDISHPVEVPASAALLKVGMQEGRINAWYCIDTDEVSTRIDRWAIIGTGWDMDDLGDIDYVDTLFDPEGFVWHIYKRL